jgi:predicted RNA-binding Zn ribbon-like protein
VAAAPGEDRSIALALVNTELEPRGRPLDLIADRPALGRWLRTRGLPAGAAAESDLAAVRALRSAIRAAFAARAAGTTAPRAAVAEINRAAALAPGWPRLVWGQTGPRVEDARTPGTPPFDVALARLAADAIDTLRGATGDRLRACEAHGCTRLFIQDHGRRRWCSRTCGDRVRFARHYRRTHPAR